jgi:hypothetical protein
MKDLATLNIMPQHTWTKNKNRSTSEKRMERLAKLFLPSTVLAVSGSRGLQTLPIANFRLSIELSNDKALATSQDQIGNRQSKIGNVRTLSLGRPGGSGSPETLFSFQTYVNDSKTTTGRWQTRAA